MPIFVVGVGEDRVKVKIDLVDLRAPAQIQPEDKFRIRGDVTGEGLPGEKLDVVLEVAHTRITKVKTKDKDGKVVEEEKEEELPIVLIEAENPDNPKSIREKITLGSRLQLKPAADVVLDKTSPPRAEIEWQLDAAAFGAAAKLDLLTDPKYKGKKWEIGETEDDSELRFVMKVPTDKREGLTKKFHVSTKVPTKVIKKPIRVLLLAAAANRDYQFVRTLLVREVEKKRIELAIHLQLPPGRDDVRGGRRPGRAAEPPADALPRVVPQDQGRPVRPEFLRRDHRLRPRLEAPQRRAGEDGQGLDREGRRPGHGRRLHQHRRADPPARGRRRRPLQADPRHAARRPRRPPRLHRPQDRRPVRRSTWRTPAPSSSS